MKFWLLNIILLCFVLLGCAQKRQKNGSERSDKQLYEELQQVNKAILKKEQIQIRNFIQQKGWNTTESKTGIHFWIYQEGNGDTIYPGQVVEVNLIISLLNGDTAYHYKNYGSESFLVERQNMESGLHEAVQYLTVGSKAQVVLPSHLAHGVAGDRNKIPPRSSVVYDIQVLDVRND